MSKSTTGVGDLVRFSEPNVFGVLDHAVFAEGEESVVMPMRVAANGDGTELTFISTSATR